MGDRFEWTNSGADYHSVTEQSGLDLWDSQLVRGTRSHNSETWWTKIPWAGTFVYRDMVSGFEGAIGIPVGVPEAAGAGGKVQAELGVAPPPEGTAFDVQLKAGDGECKTVHEGTRETRITIDALQSGSYEVCSRLRRIDAAKPAAESGWSPPAAFRVG